MAQRLLFLALAAWIHAACASAGVEVVQEDSSPTQTGVAARGTFRLAESARGTLMGVAGVGRQWFDGGHDNIFTVGLQGRRPIDLNEPSGAWFGAEGSYNNWRVSDDFTDPVSHVFGFGAVVGTPLRQGPLHLWGSAKLLYFGDFEGDGLVAIEGGLGWQVGVGVELESPLGQR